MLNVQSSIRPEESEVNLGLFRCVAVGVDCRMLSAAWPAALWMTLRAREIEQICPGHDSVQRTDDTSAASSGSETPI